MELIIVVAVIGILVTISALGISQYQADARDSSRQANAQTLIEALEKYYDAHGEYPSCAQMTQAPEEVVSSVLPGLSLDALSTPGTDGNAVSCEDLTSPNDGDYFAYVGDTSPACASESGNACLRYTIKYVEEASNAVTQVESRRQTLLSSQDIPTLSATAYDFVTVTTNWTTIPSAQSYVLQYSKTTTFPTETAPNTANSGTQSYSNTATAQVAGLDYDTTYYFRIRVQSATGSGGWSTTVSAKTPALGAPTLNASGSGYYSILGTWSAMPGATSYVIQYSQSGSFPSEASANTATSGTLTATTNSQTIAGLSYNTQYSLRLKAIVGSIVSDWSATVTATTTALAAPTVNYSYGTPSTAAMDYVWTSVPDATTYEFESRQNGGAWSSTSPTQTSLTTTLTSTTQGTLLEIRVRGVSALGERGTWSATRGATLGVAGPNWNRWNQTRAFPSWTTRADRTDGGALCPSGMTLWSRFRDGIYNSSWNSWTSWSNRGVSATATASYTSTINDYVHILQAQIEGYCQNATSGAVSATINSGTYTAQHPTPSISTAGAVSCSGAYSGRPAFSLVLSVDETSLDINANTSVVSWTLYRIRTSTWNGTYDQTKTWPWSVGVHYSGWSGSSNSGAFRYNNAIGATETIATGSTSVGHNSDGTLTLGFSGNDGPGSSIFGSASCSGTYTLADLRQ